MAGNRWLVFGVLVLGAALSVSCITPCLAGLRHAQAPAPTVAISDDAAKRFEDKAEGFGTKQFRIEFTEEEVTSYLALQLKDSLPLASPQVHFLPGKVVLEGDLTSPVRGHITLVGTLTVAGGRPQVQFQEARLGGITAPSSLLGSLSDSLDEAISANAADVEIQQIEVTTGRIVVSGRSREQ